MKAGILSDTHDSREATGRALDLFLREGVDVIVHLGDVCAGFTLAAFRGCGVPLVGVYGNNDGDKRGIEVASGGAFFTGPYKTSFDGRRVVMSHTFDSLQDHIVERGQFDLVLFGHTHRPLVMKVGHVLVVNPGEACGYMSGRPTCAVVDLDGLEARILDIPVRPGG